MKINKHRNLNVIYMKCYITTTSFGFIATNPDNKIIDYQLFGNKQVEKLQEIEKKQLLTEEVALIQNISESYEEIIIETNNSLQAYSKLEEFDKINVEKTTINGRFIRENLDKILQDIPELSEVDIRSKLNNTYNEIAKVKIRESIKTNDVMIVETINSLEEIEDTTGKLIERLREWCTPYVPELDKLHNHELYSNLIANETTRENIKKSPLLENTHITLSDNYDIDITEEDLAIIQNFAKSIYELYQTRKNLEEYIQNKIEEVAPNLLDVAGANLSAKLIAHMGGLEELAKLPSSTIQIIGAEKATFRHLKTGENPPKHGLIYQHPLIRGSNWWIRGKLARAVAGKITIAARKDAFGGDYDPDLKVQLDEKVEKIKKDNPFPQRKNKKKDKKNKKNKKDKKKGKKHRKQGKRNKRKLRKGEYDY